MGRCARGMVRMCERMVGMNGEMCEKGVYLMGSCVSTDGQLRLHTISQVKQFQLCFILVYIKNKISTTKNHAHKANTTNDV